MFCTALAIFRTSVANRCGIWSAIAIKHIAPNVRMIATTIFNTVINILHLLSQLACYTFGIDLTSLYRYLVISITMIILVSIIYIVISNMYYDILMGCCQECLLL